MLRYYAKLTAPSSRPVSLHLESFFSNPITFVVLILLIHRLKPKLDESTCDESVATANVVSAVLDRRGYFQSVPSLQSSRGSNVAVSCLSLVRHATAYRKLTTC